MYTPKLQDSTTEGKGLLHWFLMGYRKLVCATGHSSGCEMKLVWLEASMKEGILGNCFSSVLMTPWQGHA